MSVGSHDGGWGCDGSALVCLGFGFDVIGVVGVFMIWVGVVYPGWGSVCWVLVLMFRVGVLCCCVGLILMMLAGSLRN